MPLDPSGSGLVASADNVLAVTPVRQRISLQETNMSDRDPCGGGANAFSTAHGFQKRSSVKRASGGCLGGKRR